MDVFYLFYKLFQNRCFQKQHRLNRNKQLKRRNYLRSKTSGIHFCNFRLELLRLQALTLPCYFQLTT